ncbi:MAG: D-alanine--D-alanine ligase [Limnochordaceae bacterium]|nr:D-alanine--D-alanine ligase [Limnochordaceae bacterium]
MRLALIYGGRSSEHEVSLQSAAAIYKALAPERYRVIPIAQDREGGFWTGPALARALASAAPQLPPLGEAPPHHTCAAHENGRAEGGIDGAVHASDDDKNASWAVYARFDLQHPGFWVPATQTDLPVDMAFPIVHGSFGEDGTLQGLLEMMGIPYVGAGVAASAVGMDKSLMKALFARAGLPVLPWATVTRLAWEKDRAVTESRIVREVGFPCFVKPADRGSSVGVHKVRQEEDLPDALARAFVYSGKVVVERSAEQCAEVECAVLGNENPLTSVVGEIRTRHEFYDYEAKYQDDLSELIIPAPLSEPVVRRVQEVAAAAFRVTDCAGMARVDFFVARDTGDVFLNEINTLPGFTRFSMYPKLWEATGLPFGRLLDRLVELGQQAFAEKNRNLYRYSPKAEEDAVRTVRYGGRS